MSQQQKTSQRKSKLARGSCKSACKLTCGQCSGLHKDRLVAGNKSPCAGVGKQPTSKPCSSFKANVFSLSESNSKATETNDSLNMLASSISGFTTSELAVLAAIMLSEKKTRKQGFRFWQKVYVRISGTIDANYLSNFAVGRILDADRDFIRVISETGKSCIQVVSCKDCPTLYTVERFKELRTEMIKAKRITDPAIERNRRKSELNRLADLDQSVSSGAIPDEFTRTSKHVRKSGRMDLVGIVRKMSSGTILKRNEGGDDYEESISIYHA